MTYLDIIHHFVGINCETEKTYYEFIYRLTFQLYNGPLPMRVFVANA